MGSYRDDIVTRHHNEDWDRKTDARINRLRYELDRSFIDSHRTQHELDRLNSRSGSSDSSGRYASMIDRFMDFTESASPTELKQEFLRRRIRASIRMANDERVAAHTNVRIPQLIDRLEITDPRIAEDLKALTDEAGEERNRYFNDPDSHHYVMALYDFIQDLWYLQTLASEWKSRQRRV